MKCPRQDMSAKYTKKNVHHEICPQKTQKEMSGTRYVHKKTHKEMSAKKYARKKTLKKISSTRYVHKKTQT